MTTSAMLAFEIHAFDPFRSQWSPLSSARDFMPMTSEPAVGSVMANPPRYSALTSLGMYLRLSVSDPYFKMGNAQPTVSMLICTRSALQARAISSLTIMVASQPMSLPPYSSGMTVPRNPSSAMGLTTSL